MFLINITIIRHNLIHPQAIILPHYISLFHYGTYRFCVSIPSHRSCFSVDYCCTLGGVNNFYLSETTMSQHKGYCILQVVVILTSLDVLVRLDCIHDFGAKSCLLFVQVAIGSTLNANIDFSTQSSELQSSFAIAMGTSCTVGNLK